MKKFIIIATLCSGCVSSTFSPESGMVVFSGTTTEISNYNPCTLNNEEFIELAKFENLVYQRYDRYTADNLVDSYRFNIERVVKNRCYQFNQQAYDDSRFNNLHSRYQQEHPWRIRYTQVAPKSVPVVTKSAPKVADTKNKYWCRNDECFSNEEECRIDIDGKLYDCENRQFVACVDYLSLGQPQMSCFASTDACVQFCASRSEKFYNKFACQNECGTFDTITGNEVLASN